MNTVVPLPPNDGSQPGPSFVAPPASQVRAAPFQRASATEQRAVGGDSSRPKGRRNHTITQSVTCVTAGETAADERSVEATVEQRSSAFRFMNEPAAATDTAGDYLREPAAVVSGQIIREGDAPRETGRFGGVASSPDTDFSTPQASSPRLRATQALNAGDCVPPLSLTRPALLGGSGGEPSIPSEDAGGAKMDGCNHPGRGPSGLIRSAKSSQAATSFPYQNVEPGTSWNEAYPFDPVLAAQNAMGIS